MKETSYIYPNFPKELVKSELHLNRYIKFIDSRKQDRKKSKEDYTENHHKVPKSLKGSDSKENLIKLTAREHFIAHLILWKAFSGKMTSAFWFMVLDKRPHSGHISSKQYQVLKETTQNIVSMRSQGRLWINNGKEEFFVSKDSLDNYPMGKFTKGRLCDVSHNKGRVYINDGLKEKRVLLKELSLLLKNGWKKGRLPTSCRPKGTKLSKVTKNKMSKSAKGVKKSKEHCKHMSEANKGKPSQSKGKIYVNNGIKRILIRKAELPYYIQNGYFKGGLPRKGESIKDRVAVNKDGKRKYILLKDLDFYLEKGYSKGYPKKKKENS